MATVKMHQIKSTVGHALRYISRPDATDDGRLVSTNAAVLDPSDWRAVRDQFDITRSEQVAVGRKGSVLAHHVIQSFAPGEVSPDEAHAIGMKFAQQITRGKFEFMLATHVDKQHVHNHVIINSVSYETHRKFRVQRDTLAGFRRASDRLCVEHQLSVIQSRDGRTGQNIAAVYASARGVSQHDQVRFAIDRAVGHARNWGEFETALQAQGVTVNRSSKQSITFQGFGMERPVRDYRLGVGYAEDELAARLGKNAVIRFDANQGLVVNATERSVTLRVPGTQGQRLVAVGADQIVRHGETLRVYLPTQGYQALLDANGRRVAQVPTRALYAAFAPPARELKRRFGLDDVSRQVRRGRRAQTQLDRMKGQAAVLNARARYGIATAQQAIGQAGALGRQMDAVQQTIQSLVVERDATQPGSRERRNCDIRLAGAKNTLERLQGEATALVSWASTLDQSTHEQLRNMTLRDRLRGLSTADVARVTGQAQDDPELDDPELDDPPRGEAIDRGTSRESAPDDDRARRPASWSRMTMRERLAWVREQDRIASRGTSPDDDPTPEWRR